MKRRGRLNILIIAGCMVLIALTAVFIGYTVGAARVSADDATVPVGLFIEESSPTPALPPIEIIEPPALSGSIAVPGFERLTVRGRMPQADNIGNPASNTCYFVVTLLLADGSKFYRSGVLGPGQSVGVVELANATPAGTHEGAVARYSAYSLDNLTPLNGADIAFVLEVLP